MIEVINDTLTIKFEDNFDIAEILESTTSIKSIYIENCSNITASDMPQMHRLENLTIGFTNISPKVFIALLQCAINIQNIHITFTSGLERFNPQPHELPELKCLRSLVIDNASRFPAIGMFRIICKSIKLQSNTDYLKDLVRICKLQMRDAHPSVIVDLKKAVDSLIANIVRAYNSLGYLYMGRFLSPNELEEYVRSIDNPKLLMYVLAALSNNSYSYVMMTSSTREHVEYTLAPDRISEAETEKMAFRILIWDMEDWRGDRYVNVNSAYRQMLFNTLKTPQLLIPFLRDIYDFNVSNRLSNNDYRAHLFGVFDEKMPAFRFLCKRKDNSEYALNIPPELVKEICFRKNMLTQYNGLLCSRNSAGEVETPQIRNQKEFRNSMFFLSVAAYTDEGNGKPIKLKKIADEQAIVDNDANSGSYKPDLRPR